MEFVHGSNEIEQVVEVISSVTPTQTSSNIQRKSLGDSGVSKPKNIAALVHGGTKLFRQLKPHIYLLIELVSTISQIVASVIVLGFTKDEYMYSPIFSWLIGYTSGCVAILPLIYWKYRNKGRGSTTRIKVVLTCYYKVILDCLFGIWLVVGTILVFGSVTDTLELYIISIIFLIISHIGNVMPFFLLATTCFRVSCTGNSQMSGATMESINSLPIHKFRTISEADNDFGDGGIVAEGTDKERHISKDDAICWICLDEYGNNDDIIEFPCSHLFHPNCVDQWLKINATCPVCKSRTGKTLWESIGEATFTLRQSIL